MAFISLRNFGTVVVQRDGYKIQALRRIVRIKLDQIGKLLAAGIAPGRPEIHQQRARVFRVPLQELFETLEIDFPNLAGRPG